MKKKFRIIIVLLSIIFLIFFLKILYIFLLNKYGLGNPLIYKQSNIFNYEVKENQEIVRLGNKIKINSDGMRSKEWVKNNKDLKIIFFGDSVTYGGSIVSNNELFSELICSKLKIKLNTLTTCGNYGVNGYSLYLINKKIKYKKIKNKDFIVVIIIANDLLRDDHHIKSQPFWSKKINNFLPAFTEIFFIYLDRFRNNYKFTIPVIDQNLEYINNIVEEFSNTLEEQKKPYIVLYSPEKDELTIDKQKYKEIKLILKRKIKNFYDLSEHINKENIFHDNVHLNKKGHTLYSNIISEIILNKIKLNY